MAASSLPRRVRQRVAKLGVTTAGRLPAGVRRAINTARGIDTPRLVDTPPGTRPLVLSPHPDDELIGVGGTTCRHLIRGDHPVVVQLTSGERSAGLAHLDPPARGPHREGEARAAAAALGLDETAVVFLRLPDGGIDDTDDDQAAALAHAIAPRSPDLIYAPWPIDAHRDHTATTSMLTAILDAIESVSTIALYEVWSPLAPTHVVDITDHLDTKLAALSCYESALTAVDYVHTARGLAAYRSAQGLRGRGYAEAFTVVSPAGLRELLAALKR